MKKKAYEDALASMSKREVAEVIPVLKVVADESAA